MKKILKAALIAAMGALMLGMVSCKKDEDSEKSISQKGFGDNASWDVDIANDTDGYKRAWNVESTGHTSGDVDVTIEDSNAAGVIGLIFGVDQHKDEEKDKVYDFGLVGLKRKGKDVDYYISWFKNVSTTDDNLNKANNFCDKEGVEIGKTGCLATEVGDKKDITTLKANIAEDGKPVTIKIHLEATGTDKEDPLTKKKDGVIKQAESDGGYKVVIKDADGNELASTVITPEMTGNDKVKQGGFGCYKNTYPRKTLKGKVQVTALVQELAVEE